MLTFDVVLLLNSHLDGWDAQYLSHLDDCACPCITIAKADDVVHF